MRLRSGIFIVSFSVSAALLGGAAVALTAFYRSGGDRSLSSLEAAVDELSAMARALAEGEAPDPDAMMDAVAPIRRDLATRTVLERDAAVSSALAWAAFLGVEAVAALLASALAAAALTRRWSRLRDGVLRIRRGEAAEPFFAGARDEFGAVEEELDGLVAALGERERIRSELRALQGWGEASAFLAHQARTPLASLELSAGSARLAIEGGAEAADALRYLDRVETEAARIQGLFARVRSMSGFKDPEPVRLDPAEAFYEAAATLRARGAAIADGELAVERAGGESLAKFDRGYLVEAFVNLLDNSLEACAERSIPFGARLRLGRDGARYVIEYTDSVTGLPAELAERVGSVRYSTKPRGSGLGVWLVRRIAALHGGELSVRLSDAGGLAFTLVFPNGGEGDG
ncbi:MAG: hypothetical protein H7A27_06445 [Spirochaetaceae bacterium]|nr:hypothetical protein [Spirochaetaceae bacterium]